MRGIVFSLLIAVVGSQTNDLEPGFSNDKSYLYHYKGRILIGLEKGNLMKSGLQLSCQVKISRVSQADHVLQVLSPEFEEYNGIWPRDPFIKKPKVTEKLGLCFTKLFKFEYREGRVGNIYGPKDSPVICVDIIKGILDLLQLTIKETELQETRSGGTCNTKYIIQNEKTDKTSISRITDLNNCTDKVVKNVGMAYIRPCPTCLVNITNTRGTAVANYQLKYTDTGALIIHAESLHVQEISPFNQMAGTAVMEARQNMTLVETTSNEERIPDTLLQNYGNLKFQFPEDISHTALHLLKTNSPKSRIVQTLEELVQQNQLDVDAETPLKFLELIELSQAAPLEILESLWKQFADRQQFRCWLLSAYAAAGSTETFVFIKERIHNEDLNLLESAISLVLAFHLTEPNNLTLRAATELIACPKVQNSSLLHSLAYLAFGSMINKHCSDSSDCSPEILQPFHDLATEAANINNEEDILLALKAMGNAGLPDSIRYIKKFLPGFSAAAKNLPERIHVAAVLALRKIARKKSDTVRELAFQIFINPSHSPKVRMLSCIVFFETKPDLPFVTALASFVQRESSLQVASFAYSHMKALTMSRVPQLENLSTACRIAIILLTPRLENMSLRYSRVIHFNGYNWDYKAGGIGRVYIMNSPDTILPSIIAKIRGYYANFAMDMIEVGVNFEGLEDLFKTEPIPSAAESLTFKKIKELGKLLHGLTEFHQKKSLFSSYIKVDSYEIAFGDLHKDLIQNLATKSAEALTAFFRNGLIGNWTQPVLAGALQHLIPTPVGFPVEFSLYSSSVVHTAVKVNGQISPPMTNELGLQQLLKSNMHLSAEVNTSTRTHSVAVMGIITPDFQAGLEFHAKFHANIPLKFDAKLNMKEESFAFEFTPVQEETTLLDVRTKVYAVSRNVDDLSSAKISPVLPEVTGFDILDYCFKTPEGRFIKEQTMFDFMSTKFASGINDTSGRQTSVPNFYIKLPALGYQTCLTSRQCNTAVLGETSLHKFFGGCEFNIAVKPDASRTKIHLEFHVESKINSEITQERDTEEMEGEDKSFSYRGRGSKPQKRKYHMKKEMARYKKRRETEQSKFLDQYNKPCTLAVVLSIIQNEKKQEEYRLEIDPDFHSSRPTLQMLVSDLMGSRRAKVCAYISILHSQKAEGYLKWGQDCQDYKIAAQIEYGQLAGYPAMQFKTEWLRIPTTVEAGASGLFTFVPGMAYALGFSQIERNNPSKQASVVLVLTSQRSYDVIWKFPKVTLFCRDTWLPVPLSEVQQTKDLAIKSHAWSFISNVPSTILENLKGNCLVSGDQITTFNKVNLNYTMPANCSHVLAYDCSSERKFLVTIKEVNNLKIIHTSLANLEIDMYPSKGIVKLKINGNEILPQNLPYTSSSDGYVLLTPEKNGVLLKAPDSGIDKLFYDGHTVQIQVSIGMMGKTCGLCGKYDAEYEKEYKMPSGFLAKNALSFAKSWILPEDSCARETSAVPDSRKL